MASSQKLTSYKFTGILLQDVKTDSGPTGVFYDFMQGDTSLVPQSAMSRIIAWHKMKVIWSLAQGGLHMYMYMAFADYYRESKAFVYLASSHCVASQNNMCLSANQMMKSNLRLHLRYAHDVCDGKLILQ